MDHNLDNTISLLTRTPSALDALLRGLPEAWTQHNEGQYEGKDTWTVRQVIAHLIHTDRINWVPRAKWIVQFGETRPFEPATLGIPRHESLEQLLDEFVLLRSECLSDLRALNLTPSDLARRGLHPKFGIVTLSQLLATWTVHDLTHLHQISRILAHQYREAVGSWSEFLGVLQCNGHSSF